MGRTRVKAVLFTRADLERHLIDKLGMPEDIVVTGISKPVNQEAYVVMVQSDEFPEMMDLSTVAIVLSDNNRLFRSES